MVSRGGGAKVSERPVTDRLSAFARDIAAQPDGPATIARAVDLASKVVCCSLVDIVRVRAPGGLSVVGSTDPDWSDRLVELSDIGAQGSAAFCRSVMGSAVLTDLRSDDRWPRYTPELLEATNLQFEMDIALDVAGGDPLVLRFFSEQADPWSDDDCRDAMAFAELTALAIDRAGLLTTVRNLREALGTNRLIGAATGILMTRHRVTYEVAFEFLRTASQHTNCKLSKIADEVVLTGDLPGAAGRSSDERSHEEPSAQRRRESG